MKLCKKIFGIILPAFIILMLVSSTVLAAYGYYATVQVQETGGNSYDYLPIIADIDNNYLANNGYISLTGLDTRILSGSTRLEHLIADDKILFVVPSVGANSTGNYRYTLGNDPLEDFPIIIGVGGYITIDDPDSFELGRNFDIEIDGYFDMGQSGTIIEKVNSFRIDADGAGSITAHLLDADGSDNTTVTASLLSDREMVLTVSMNGRFAIAIDGNTQDSVVMPVGAIGPSSVTGDNNIKVPYSISRSSFYANGRYWIFYNNVPTYQDVSYKTSTDGTSWSGEITISSSVEGFSLHWDGTYVHFVKADISTHYLYYRRGVPSSDGSINWSASWQSIITGIDENYGEQSVAVDSSGHPWVTYITLDPNTGWVSKSSTTDGTWSTDSGFPFVLPDYPKIVVLPLTDDKMYVIWGTGNILGKLYDGESWGDVENIDTSGRSSGYSNSYSSYGDNVWAATYYNLAFDYKIYARMRDYDGTPKWGSQTTIYAGADVVAAQLSVDASSGDVILFYTNQSNEHIYYKRYDSGTELWGSEVDWETDGDGIFAGNRAGTFYQQNAGVIGFYWLSESAPTSVKYKILELNTTAAPLNGNDWTLNEDNILPYMEYYKHTVSDTLIAWYQPLSMIMGDNLDDRAGTDDGEGVIADNDIEEDATITWGENPADLSATVSSLISPDQPEIPPPSEEGAIDIVPEGEVPAAGGVVNVGKLDNNPLYFAVEIISEYTKYTEEQIWFIGATFIILIGMGISAVKVPSHLLLAGTVGLVLGGFFTAMQIYQWWMMLIFGFMFVMTILMERKPVL